MGENKKMLILELGGIGDVVMSLPAIEAVLAGYKDHRITVLTVSRTRPIIESLREKGFRGFKIISTDAIEEGSLTGWLRLIKELRRQRFGIVMDLSVIETYRAAVKRFLFLKTLNARESVGRDTEGRGCAFTKKTTDALTSSEHEVERKIKVAELLGLKSSQTAPKLITSRDEKEKAVAKLSGFTGGNGFLAGVNPGAYRPSRMWPEERFREIIKWLIEDMSAHVILTGGRGEEAMVESMAAHFPDDKIRTIIDIPLMELAAVLEKMNIFITNDTGPMHMAAALNVPTVAIFGQTNLFRYHPYMDSSRYIALKGDYTLCKYFSFKHPMEECRLYRCEDKSCINDITTDEVRKAVIQLLPGRMNCL